MNGEGQLSLNLDAGRAARDAGMALVEEHHPSDVERVQTLILRLIGERRHVTADTVQAAIDWPLASAAVVGTAFSLLARRKAIRKVGFAQSRRPNQHACSLWVWGAGEAQTA